PALPDAWPAGEIKGLKARGNFEVSMKWKDQRLTGAVITSGSGGICKLRTSLPVKIAGVTTQSVKDDNGYVLSFNTVKGTNYVVTAIK
ncbi:MAG: glycoside hydrolase family 95-like protein, partial [Ferruginibacter sp.]